MADPHTWAPQQTQSWVEEQGFEALGSSLAEHEVDGETLIQPKHQISRSTSALLLR